MLFIGPDKEKYCAATAWGQPGESRLRIANQGRELVPLFNPAVTGDIASAYAIGNPVEAIIYAALEKDHLDAAEAAERATQMLTIEAGGKHSLYRRVDRKSLLWIRHRKQGLVLQNKLFETLNVIPAQGIVGRIIPNTDHKGHATPRLGELASIIRAYDPALRK